jgi:tetratricopeptide (TPR) repeat protein
MRGAKPPLVSCVDWTEELRRLDRGHCAEAVAKLQHDTPDDDPAHRVWRASMLIYTEDYGKVEQELDAGEPFKGEIVYRAALVRSALALFREAPDECERWALAVDEAAPAAQRAYALALMARASVKRRNWREGLERINLARPGVEREGLELMAAALDHCEAFCRMWLDDGAGPSVGDLFQRALDRFRALGDQLWEGRCRSIYGAWLASVDRVEEAEGEYRAARRIARAIKSPALRTEVQSNLAQLLAGAGRYEDAIEALGPILDAERRAGAGTCEANSLVVLAYSLGMTGRWSEAVDAANAARALAAMIAAPTVAFDARTVGAWAEARAGNPEAVEVLRRMRAGAARLEEEHRYRAALYLADALLESDPLGAAELIAEAARSPQAATKLTEAKLLAYVRHRAASAPVHVDDEGRFVIDPRHGVPDTDAAGRLAEAFVFRWVWRESGERRSVAAQILGVTRQAIHARLTSLGLRSKE